jgi:cobalt/nickel transport system permease protein
MVAAFLTSAQLAVSGTSDWDVVLPAMLGVHALIGIGEGLISAGAVVFILATRPDLLGITPAFDESDATFAGERA